MAASYDPLPLGVAILAVLIGIFGALLLVVGILVLLAIGVGATAGLAIFGGGLLGGLLLVLIGAVILAVAKGLWDQELWALVLCLILVGLLVLSDLLRGTILSLGGLILVVLLIYLVAVHKHFR